MKILFYRRREWLLLCHREDLIDKDPSLLSNTFLCSLHFDKSMYINNNLKRHATPSPNFTRPSPSCQDSSTQTSEPNPVKTELPEATTSLSHTEDFFQCAYRENYDTNTQFEEQKMQSTSIEREIKNETKVKADDKKLLDIETYQAVQKSTDCKKASNEEVFIITDSEEESEDDDEDGPEMSIDEFLKENEDLENEIRKELIKKNIPQKPRIPPTMSQPGILINKEVQTDNVSVYDIPENNICFQQCLRCGKNANMLTSGLKPDHRIQFAEFEAACERFLSPMFCATVKNQLKLERIQRKNKFIKDLMTTVVVQRSKFNQNSFQKE